jgi:ABC-type uncharacterized transport system ATPase subunit
MGGRVASLTFVGRVEELQTLDAVRGRAVDVEPAVVLVGGEAGVGKTRLVAELTSRCAADGTRVLVGGCVPADSRRPCGGHGQDRGYGQPTRRRSRSTQHCCGARSSCKVRPLPAT